MKKYTGLNIQFPISQLILDGSKTIETRTYQLPKKLENIELLIVETPGKTGRFKSRIVGKIIFSSSFQYKNKKEFYDDFKKHQVEQDSDWAWGVKPKWAWLIEKVEVFKNPKPVKKRLGIIYTNDLEI